MPLAVVSNVDQEFANMPPKTADLAETWAFLDKGVDRIMNNLEAGLAFTGYTSLYTTVYNYCTSTKMHGRLDTNRCKLLISSLTYKYRPLTVHISRR